MPDEKNRTVAAGRLADALDALAALLDAVLVILGRRSASAGVTAEEVAAADPAVQEAIKQLKLNGRTVQL